MHNIVKSTQDAIAEGRQIEAMIAQTKDPAMKRKLKAALIDRNDYLARAHAAIEKATGSPFTIEGQSGVQTREVLYRYGYTEGDRTVAKSASQPFTWTVKSTGAWVMKSPDGAEVHGWCRQAAALLCDYLAKATPKGPKVLEDNERDPMSTHLNAGNAGGSLEDPTVNASGTNLRTGEYPTPSGDRDDEWNERLRREGRSGGRLDGRPIPAGKAKRAPKIF